MRRPLPKSAAIATALALLLPAGSCDTVGPDTVSPRVPASLQIQGGDGQTGTVGHPLGEPLTVRVTAEDGEALAGVEVGWAPAAGSVSGSVSTTDGEGLATVVWTLGTTAGAQTVAATVASLPSVEFSAAAEPDVPAAITLSPATLSFTALADTSRFSTVVQDQHGNSIPDPALAWTSANTAVATVDASGLVTSRASGTTEVGVTAGTAQATAAVEVAQEPARILAAPAVDTIASGSTLQLSATVEDANGHDIPGVEATWMSLDGSIATVDTAGLATALGVGSAGLVASSGSVADTAEITVTPGDPATLAPSAGDGQSATVGTAVAIDPAVLVTDAHGNPVEGVAVAFSVTAGGGSTTADTVLTAADGTAAVGWTLGTAAGANELVASIEAGDAVTFSATGEPGAAAALSFSTQPTSVVAGVAISPAVEVSIVDEFGNLVADATDDVTVAIGTDPDGSGTLSGTATVAAVGGVATFPDLWIDEAALGYDLTASSGTLTGATSASFDVTAAPADHLVFAIQPIDTRAGDEFGVQVLAFDPFDNLDSSFNDLVGVFIEANPYGGAVGGDVNVIATDGIANFSSLVVNTAGTYALIAEAGSDLAVASDSFDVTPGPADHLVFSVQPSDAEPGATISPAVEVSIVDPYENLVTDAADAVTVAIGTNPSGGVLSGTLTTGASSGVATFADLAIDQAGTGYDLTASADTLAGTTSASFDIMAVADADADGYGSDVDCNDADPTVHPGATEVGDGQDNDCDGVIPAEEIDNDADGFVEATIDGGGWDGDPSVLGGDDCDDLDANTFPGAAEIADGKDNDCDGQVDEGIADPTTTTITADPPIIPIPGMATITVQLKDASGTNLTSGSGYTVELTAQAGTLSSVSDMGDGTFTATLTSSTGEDPGYYEVRGTLNGVDISDYALVGFAAEEVCDGIDNDLDGDIDEGLFYCVGGVPADNTDGETCNAGFYDLDGDRTNGCESTAPAPTAGDLVITEIMFDPVGLNDTYAEWIEVANVSGSGDLELYSSELHLGAEVHAISGPLVVPDGGRVVIGRCATDNGGISVDYALGCGGGAISNSTAEAIAIYSPSSTLVDQASTIVPWNAGSAQSLDPNFLDATSNDAGSSWCEATSVYDTNGNSGTPGSANDPCP